MVRFDKNDKILSNGDIIDIHQTVNGHNKFIVLDINNLDIRYADDISRKYEYDKHDLLSPCKFSGDVTFEIIGKLQQSISHSHINFNVNSNIKVQLTDIGYRLLIDHYNKYSTYMSVDDVTHVELIAPDGYVTMQMWEFMNIFGKVSYNGGKQYYNANLILSI